VQLGLEPLDAIDLLIEGADRFLKHDLLRGRQPNSMFSYVSPEQGCHRTIRSG
jgi:hypothetical protein